MSKCCRYVRCLLLILFAGRIAGAGELSIDERQRVDATVKSVMEDRQLVGVAVGVLRDGEVVYVNAYGDADRERHVPASTATVFNWASNSKPVVAVLAMQLMEQGRLSLDDDVSKYVADFPAKKWPVRIRDILCHQSGIPHYSNGEVRGTPREFDAADAFLNPVNSIYRFHLSPLLYEPRTQTTYSSYAYVLLSAVVQQAAEEDLNVLLKRRITEPLGLKTFQLDIEGPQDGWAVGYGRKGSEEIQPVAEEAHYWKHGAGGYKSSVGDFARWAQALLNGELISPETAEIMCTVQQHRDGTQADWGLGLKIESDGPTRKISHNGGQDETRTRMVLYPEQRHGVVVMCNCNFANPSELTTAVYAALRQK